MIISTASNAARPSKSTETVHFCRAAFFMLLFTGLICFREATNTKVLMCKPIFLQNMLLRQMREFLAVFCFVRGMTSLLNKFGIISTLAVSCTSSWALRECCACKQHLYKQTSNRQSGSHPGLNTSVYSSIPATCTLAQ